ncbi:MAG TPA: bifunctional hydroxymethylpyrimidine kinase/phosphomethylpyrimidine kinase, partial [Propioniciclava sp.]
MHLSAPLRPAVPRVLSIAGTDPTGGAGTAADLKSITAAGGYGMAVVTSLVAQNTRGVRDVHLPPTAFLTEQLDAVSDDVDLHAVKTGMLATADIIAAVATWLEAHPPAVLVVDPVMVATSGDRLLDADAEAAMRDFCRRASVITPNTDELAVLTQSTPATTQDEAIAQARGWAQETGTAVVVKTG